MTAVKNTPAPLLEREAIEKQIKPLSKNPFLAFFQRIARGWLKKWYGFSDKRPGLARVLYMAFFFIIFSQAVTVLQGVLFGVLPQAFVPLNYNGWIFPNGAYLGTALMDIPVYAYNAAGNAIRVGYIQDYVRQYFAILGSPVVYRYSIASGAVVRGAAISSGLAYFLAIAIAIFIAQVINFPLQRNITFRSKGNPAYQAMWYLIGWMLIQPLVFGIGSLWRALVAIQLGAAWPPFAVLLLDLIVTGGVSMIIFFFIFKIIFPDRNAVAKRTKAKLDAAKAKGVTGKRLEKLEVKARDAEIRARQAEIEKTARKSKSQASAKAMAYFAAEKRFEKSDASLKAAQGSSGSKLANAQLNYATAKQGLEEKHQSVSDFAQARVKAEAELETMTTEFNAYKAELGLKK